MVLGSDILMLKYSRLSLRHGNETARNQMDQDVRAFSHLSSLNRILPASYDRVRSGMLGQKHACSRQRHSGPSLSLFQETDSSGKPPLNSASRRIRREQNGNKG